MRFWKILKCWGGVNLASFLGLRKYRVSLFSLIISEEVEICEGARIGLFNLIKCKAFHMGPSSGIGKFNIFIGNFNVVTDRESKVDSFNKFTCSSKADYHIVTLRLKENSHIVTGHLFDMTDNITIGARSIVAGSGSQFWTHSYFIDTNNKEIRIDAPIIIGKRCYVGARCCILSGVEICDDVIIGAMTCVSKSLHKSGTYVGCGMRYFEKDDGYFSKLGEPSCGTNIYRRV